MIPPRPDAASSFPAHAAAAGTAGIAQAFERALVSQLHPNMQLAVLLPFVIALLGALLRLWPFCPPRAAWLRVQAPKTQAASRANARRGGLGVFPTTLYLIPAIAAAILRPVSGILGLAIAAVFLMPLVVRHVGAREYA